MTERIIRETAELWLSLGGDSEGITWCWMRLRDEVKKIESERENELITRNFK